MERILFFDGVCNLCNSSVDFLIRQDPDSELKFASLQSDIAEKKLAEFNLSNQELSSLVYYKNESVYTHSEGAIRVFADLGGWRKVVLAFLVIPGFFRDAIYSWIAKNRYQWFGKKETCRMPTPEERDRILG
jgi:predicted DCC family thiol-disulfide oxidoreductase YuxK